jgi:lactate dehydrogenase-like 2-hydroxyacid dehydrogenase
VQKFSKIKDGSRVINIARGKRIDEQTLIEVLKNGQISCHGLNVHGNEPHVNAELAAMENVELLCHAAGASLFSRSLRTM